jgi:hypothetical protein
VVVVMAVKEEEDWVPLPQLPSSSQQQKRLPLLKDD